MLLKFIKFYGCRNFSRTNIWRNIEKSKLDEPASTSSKSPLDFSTKFKPTEWEKKLLVWSGKYKLNDIPPTISYSALDNARSRLRIKIANVLMVATLVLCGYYVYIGKENQKKGDSFVQREAEFYKNLKNE